MLRDLSGFQQTVAYNDSEGEHYYDHGFTFNMEKITKDNSGNYICSNNTQALNVFNALFETIKTLINDIDTSLLNQIGGDNRLKEILYYMWNDLATGGTANLEYMLNDITNKLFSVADMTEYLNRT